MKLYFIPVIVFIMQINNSTQSINKTTNESTIIWMNQTINEDEFSIEEILYETNKSDDLNYDSIQQKANEKRKPNKLRKKRYPVL